MKTEQTKAHKLDLNQALKVLKAAPGPDRLTGVPLDSLEAHRLWSEWMSACQKISLMDTNQVRALLALVPETEFSASNLDGNGTQILDHGQVKDLVDKAFWLNRMLFEIPEREKWQPGMYRYGLSLRTMQKPYFNPLYPLASTNDGLTLATNDFSYPWFGPPPVPLLEFDQFVSKFTRRPVP